MSTLTARIDADPQQEPMSHEPAEEKDWYDLALDAERSCRNATRCADISMKRANLIIARTQLSQALERLR